MFGEKVRQLREQLNFTQEELAHLVGVHANTISSWENGTIPNMKRVIQLAKTLNTTTTYLLDETDNPQPKTSGEEKISPPVVRDRTVIKDPSFVKEGNLIGNKNVLVYEVNGERFILPATKENQSWFRDFMMTAMSSRAVAPA